MECAMIDNPEISLEGLMEHIKGPDFPTGGIFIWTQRYSFWLMLQEEEKLLFVHGGNCRRKKWPL